MSKTMQNLVVMMERPQEAYGISLKTGNMILNRFCIDEDAAFELSGVNYLKEYPKAMRTLSKTEEKGKKYPLWRSYLY